MPRCAAEQQDLLALREEEELARDVCAPLAARWHQRPFENIVGAELSHMNTVRAALAGTASARLRERHTELKLGWRNHLRAFFPWQQQLGGACGPRHLRTEDFPTIATSPQEVCWQQNAGIPASSGHVLLSKYKWLGGLTQFRARE